MMGQESRSSFSYFSSKAGVPSRGSLDLLGPPRVPGAGAEEHVAPGPDRDGDRAVALREAARIGRQGLPVVGRLAGRRGQRDGASRRVGGRRQEPGDHHLELPARADAGLEPAHLDDVVGLDGEPRIVDADHAAPGLVPGAVRPVACCRATCVGGWDAPAGTRATASRLPEARQDPLVGDEPVIVGRVAGGHVRARRRRRCRCRAASPPPGRWGSATARARRCWRSGWGRPRRPR